jgi:hypothetical protein
MANIVSLAEVLGSEGGGLYLNADEKWQLHTEQRPFWIVNAVGEQEGQFGPQSVFYIREKGKEDAKLAFGVNEQRKELARKATAAIAAGNDHIGPCYLGRWGNETRGGWCFTYEPSVPVSRTAPGGTPTTSASAPTPSPAVQGAIDAGDDLPF